MGMKIAQLVQTTMKNIEIDRLYCYSTIQDILWKTLSSKL